MKQKKSNIYKCNNCDFESVKWLGHCPDCDAWNSFELSEKIKEETSLIMDASDNPVTLSEISSEGELRILSDIGEIDRVFGNGIVRGSLVLIGGEPGIGKSTLMLQYSSRLAEKGLKVLYISGEESLKQIKLRATRLGLSDSKVAFINTTCFEKIKKLLDDYTPDLIVADSIQTLYTSEVDSLPGSINQIKEVSFKLMDFAKSKGVIVLLVGHITKEGTLAGPKILEHLVDTVIYFESDPSESFRLLRCTKNRFGSTNEIGIFEMTASGLVEIENPSTFFISKRDEKVSGTAVTCCFEGTRPIMVEVQALVSNTNYSIPKRVSIGIDTNRLSLIISILEKRGKLKLSNKDVIVKVVGGLKMVETSVDLAIAVAIISSYFEREFKMDTIFNGEIDLTGKIRAITQAEKRVQEADKLGFIRFVLPICENLIFEPSKIKITQLDTIQSLISRLFEKK